MSARSSAGSRHRWFRDAVRSRRLINALLIAVAAIATAAAVFGPLSVRAVAQFTVQDSVQRAGVAGTAITATSTLQQNDAAPILSSVERVVNAAPQTAATLWTAPQGWTESSANVDWSTSAAPGVGQTSRVQLAGIGCRQWLASGSCPSKPGQVALSIGTAGAAKLALGSVVELRLVSAEYVPPPPIPMTVVGLYDPARATTPMTRPSSAGGSANGSAGATTTPLTAPVTTDPVLMTTAQAISLQVPIQVSSRVLLRTGLHLQDEAGARRSVAAVDEAVLHEGFDITHGTGLTDLLDQVDTRVRAATVLVLVTEVQALALAAFALAVVLQRIALVRTAEWGIGRLRGIPTRRWYASIYLEPAASLLVGSVLGYLVGVLGARLLLNRVLSIGTSAVGADLNEVAAKVALEPWRWPVLVAAGGLLVAFALALIVVSGPSLRRPLVELIQQRSEVRRLGVLGAIAQAAVILVGTASLYQLRFGGVLSRTGSQLGLLAPAFLALSAALIAVRLAVLVVRRVTRRPPRSLTALVVGRQAARTPSSLNPALVVAVGTALAIFATQVSFVSVRNQELRAAAIVGAPTVLEVQAPSGADLISLVDTADPSGRMAMAAQQVSRSTDRSVSRILAVDSSRLTAVTGDSTQWLGQGEIRALQPATASPVTITGSTITVRLSDVHLGAGSVMGAVPVLFMTLAVDGRWETISLGAITGHTTLRSDLPCPRGCRLVSLALQSNVDASYSAELTITSLSTDVQSATAAATWLRTSRWRTRVGDRVSADPRTGLASQGSTAGLRLKAFDLDGGNLATALPADVTDPLPALVAPATGVVPFAGIPDTINGVGMDGAPQLLRVVGQPAVLPRLLTEGVLVDLKTAQRLSDPSQGQRVDEVWLAAGAPARIEQSFTAAGVTVIGRQQIVTEARQLGRAPSTRAAAVAEQLGIAALLLTLIALVASRSADATRRRPDWKSLLDGGLTRRTVRRLAFVETAIPVIIGALLGVASGVIGFALAAARLPLVDLSTPGPPLDLRLAWPPVVLIAVVVLVVTVVISVITARTETRSSRTQGLR